MYICVCLHVSNHMFTNKYAYIYIYIYMIFNIYVSCVMCVLHVLYYTYIYIYICMHVGLYVWMQYYLPHYHRDTWWYTFWSWWWYATFLSGNCRQCGLSGLGSAVRFSDCKMGLQGQRVLRIDCTLELHRLQRSLLAIMNCD